jgi:hypothetical protein
MEHAACSAISHKTELFIHDQCCEIFISYMYFTKITANSLKLNSRTVKVNQFYLPPASPFVEPEVYRRVHKSLTLPTLS